MKEEEGEGTLGPHVKVLRRHPSPAQQLLWSRLRKMQLGVRFRRMHVRQGFILEFYCPSHRLVIETDFLRHDHVSMYDDWRTAVMQAIGLRFVRYPDERVLNELDGVVADVVQVYLWPGR